MTDHDVILVGAGPTAMMLGAELRLHGVDVVAFERLAEPSQQVRALGLHVRSIEILAMRGMLEPFLAHGTQYPLAQHPLNFASIPKPWPTPLDTDHPYILGIPQPVTERLLTEHAEDAGVVVHRGRAVVAVQQDASAASVTLDDGTVLTAQWVVGCDGGRSLVRKQIGVGFPGDDASQEWLRGEMQATASLEEIMEITALVRRTHLGFGVGPSGPGLVSVVVPAASVSTGPEREPTLDDVRERLIEVAGTDFGVHSPTWLSRFGDATRLADAYRVGRVLLAGDAAHVHPPLGGQGLNLGIQDAFNLGWKLAAQVRGTAPDGLLDTYFDERHPVAADVLNTTRAQSVLISPEPGPQAVRALLTELMDLDGVNRALTAKITGTEIRYDFGASDPRVGRRLRGVQMESGRGLLLGGSLDANGWRDRVDVADKPGETSMLVRPDGHVAWVGTDGVGLREALTRWFGPASPAVG